jgi:G3E family GTPase
VTIPVTVIGGYLGAGKTTLVNHLLRHAQDRRLAVLVNDFGELPIDADLIEAEDDGVISIAGGCICCSFGSDLMTVLMALAGRTPVPDHVLIETSGVALPDVVARSVSLVPGFALDGVIVLADAETVLERAGDRYMRDTVARQLAGADLVVLNKTDLAAPRRLVATRDRLRAVRVVEATHARVPIDVVLGAGLAREDSGGRRDAGDPGADATGTYDRAVISVTHPVDVSQLAAALACRDVGVIRAKGVLDDRDASVKTLHVVGARFAVTPAPAEARRRGLVCIGVKGRLDHAAIERAVADAT